MNDRDYSFRGSLIKPTIYTDFLESNRADHIMKIAVICAVVAVPFIVFQFLHSNSNAGFFSFLLLILIVLSALYLKKTYTTHSKIIFSVVLSVVVLVVPLFSNNKPYENVFIFVYPMIIFMTLGLRLGVIFSALFLAVYSAFLFLYPVVFGESALDFSSIYSIRYDATLLIVSIISYFMEQIRRDMLTSFFKNAYFDDLLKLPNRQYLNNFIQHALDKKVPLALILMDLDRFQIINETLGYSAGDVVLSTMVSRVKETLRQTDLFARIGGDSFVIVIEKRVDNAHLHLIVQRILSSIRDEILINDEKLNITASLGVAFCPDHGENSDDLIKSAEIAMYRAKAGGGNIFSIYDDEYYKEIEEKLIIQTKLKQALDNQELEVFYQPKIAVSNGEVAGMEALIRWKREDGSYLPPDQFIPIAEECGLIYPISRWVIREALYKLADLHKSGLKDLHMAVNISPLLFRSMTFANSLLAVVEETGLDPGVIELEITEGILMDEEEQVRKELDKIKKAGFRLALDDFGTGYSSLSYLKQFNINALKIDRSFISKMANDSDYLEIVKAIVSIAKNLNLDTVAEGVEEQFEFEMLREMDCNQIQGFYFSEAVPYDDLKSFIRDHCVS